MPGVRIRPGISAVFRILDSLLSEEELVMKLCCAILGNLFTRDMLYYVLSPNSPREFALAIKKLFELKVLACAKGDFSDGELIVTPEKTWLPPNYDEITCECRDNKIDETCLDLPKYASCGFIQFYNPYIRDITYESSVDDEHKKEFHLRAMKYLSKQRGECPTCDYDPIYQILTTTATEQQDLMEISQISQSTRPLPSTSKQSDLLTVPVPVTPELSTEDIRDCQCLPILTEAYSQLIAYYKSADRYFLNSSKVIIIMLQYANLLIKSSDLRLALKVLGNALDVFKTTPQAEWQNKLVGGKIYSLMGCIYMELDQFGEAELYLRSSLKQYGSEFLPDNLSLKFKALRLRLKHSFGLFVMPNTSTKKNLSYWESYVCNNASEVLSHLTTLFMKMEKWQYAELAATLSLTKGLKTNNDFETLCTYYSNMLMITLNCKRTKLSAAIEGYALRLCNMKTENMTHKEVKAVTKLYTSIFWSALPHADIEKTKQIGNIALRTAKSIQALELVWQILPMLMYTCLLSKDVNAAVDILNELDLLFVDNYNNCAHYDHSRDLWYASQCMAFHLETGHVIKSHHVFERFGVSLLADYIFDYQKKEARNNYCVTMWLWFVRKRHLEEAAFWYSKIGEFYPLENYDSVVNHFNGLYILEGMIITLVYNMDENDKQSCHDIQKEIEELIEALDKSAKNMQIILPRLTHMKAYYSIVRYNDAKAFRYLEKAKKLAVESKNRLEEEWVMHSLKAWNKTMEADTLKFWQQHCDDQNRLFYYKMESNGKFGFFSLPLPRHVENEIKKDADCFEKNCSADRSVTGSDGPQMNPCAEMMEKLHVSPTHVENQIEKESKLPQNFEIDEEAAWWSSIREPIYQHGSFDCSLTGSDGSRIEPWLRAVAEILENVDIFHYLFPTHVGNKTKKSCPLNQDFETDERDADCWMKNCEPINQGGSFIDCALIGSDGSPMEPCLQAMTYVEDCCRQTSPRQENLIFEPINAFSLAATKVNSLKEEGQETMEIDKELEQTSMMQGAWNAPIPVGYSDVGTGQPQPSTSDCELQLVGDQDGVETGTVTKDTDIIIDSMRIHIGFEFGDTG